MAVLHPCAGAGVPRAKTLIAAVKVVVRPMANAGVAPPVLGLARQDLGAAIATAGFFCYNMPDFAVWLFTLLCTVSVVA